MPGVQNPHCSPCSSLKPSCSGCSSLAVARPSTVRDLAPVDLDGQHRAGLHRPAVDQHRARAAVGRVAAHVRAGQPEPAADQVGQQQPRLHLGDLLLAVDGEPDPADRDLVRGLVAVVFVNDRHVRLPFPPAAPRPRGSGRRATNVRTMCRLYSALPRWSVLGRAACAASSAACAMLSAVSGRPVSASAAAVAAMVDPPTPVSAMPARSRSRRWSRSPPRPRRWRSHRPGAPA